jgi:hypothetical protein
MAALLKGRYRGEYQNLGCWFLYQFARPEGSPDWDDLTPHQQALVRSAWAIGVASINPQSLQPEAEHGARVAREAESVVRSALELMREVE